MSKSAVERFLESQAKPVVAPKAGKPVVREATESEARTCCPAFVDGIVDQNGQPWVWTNKYGETQTGMVRTVTAAMPITYGKIGSEFVTYPMCDITPEIAQFVLKRYGKGNRDQQKTTKDRYIAAQKEGKTHDDAGWSFVGNQWIFTTHRVGGITLSDDAEHNGGHTGTSMLESGASILATLQFGINHCDIARIDDNRKRDAASVIETMKPMAAFAGQLGTIGGQQTSVKWTDAKLKSAQKSVLVPALGIVVKVRNGQDPKTGGAGLNNEGTAEAMLKYGDALVHSTQTVCLMIGDNKVFARHQLVAAFVLFCYDEAEDGTLSLDTFREQSFLEQLAIAATPTITDDSLPMVAIRSKFAEWSVAKKNTNGGGMTIRWNCLKMALLRSGDGEELPDALLEAVKPTDHSDKSLRLGGLDDYVSAVDAAMSGKTAAKTGNVPSPLFGTVPVEELVDA